MADTLYASVTNTSNILSVTVSTSHTAQSAIAVIEAVSTSLDIGDSVTVNLGYVGDHGKVFQGYVKNLEYKEEAKSYIITASDVLVRAMDYFIASSSPDDPFTRQNISAEHLVQDILALAGLTNYDSDATSFTFAIHNPLEVNLTSSYDYCRFIADLIAWHLYADTNGQVHFVNRKPFPNGDSSIGTINKAISISAKYGESDRDLRNRVVVYGAEGIHAEASASSPYLPAGFYKSVVVAAAQVFDTQDMAQQSADYNLALLNRLTISASIVIEGDYRYIARKVATFSFSEIGISGQWYIFSAEHSFGSEGYTVSMEVRK